MKYYNQLYFDIKTFAKSNCIWIYDDIAKYFVNSGILGHVNRPNQSLFFHDALGKLVLEVFWNLYNELLRTSWYNLISEPSQSDIRLSNRQTRRARCMYSRWYKCSFSCLCFLYLSFLKSISYFDIFS